VITEGGVLVLGQKQNVPGGQFESHQSFIGEMTNLQIWNSALSFYEINQLSLSCQAGHGNVLAWPDYINGSRNVAVISLSSC